jgi:DNA (cytosine-5)-methyltransferase 1
VSSDSLTFASMCSGIGSPEVAWSRLGWRAAWCAEVAAFPSAVLAARYPGVPNLGDITRIDRGQIQGLGPVDVLVAGTPCQSFSVAGLRRGLDDPRGNLALVFLGLVDQVRPRWVVWENVDGVRSSWTDAATLAPSEASRRVVDEARRIGSEAGLDLGAAFGPDDFEEADQSNDFDCFLSGLAELGYGIAWRVLDAQYGGVPQRRRRVFVVGHLGDWRRAAAVLLERESLCGNPAPSREAGAGIAASLTASLGRRFGQPAHGDTEVQLIASTGEISHCLNAGGMGRQDYETETLIAHALRADGFDASEDGTGRGTPLVPMAFNWQASGGSGGDTGVAPTLDVGKAGGTAICIPIQADAFKRNGNASAGNKAPGSGVGNAGDPMYTLDASDPHAIAVAETEIINMQGGKGSGRIGAGVSPCLGADTQMHAIRSGVAVRRLTPRECERLMGFPDDWTLIEYRGKPAADGPRYKALGNSMVVNEMEWIGRRIMAVEAVPA